MIISKISRGIVVCIFTVFIIILGIINVTDTLNNGINFDGLFAKILYIFSLAICTVLYSFIKENLSKKNVSKKINLAVRYTAVSILSMIIKMITLCIKQNLVISFVYTIITFINGLILKKIIYNISKSDVLSIIGMFMYMFLPNISATFKDSITAYLITFIILIIIMLMEMLVDELKQIGIKSKKYIVLSVIIAIFISFSMMLGINSLVWVFSAIVTLVCTSNMDRTHINFSNKFINTLRQRSKELLYRFERIYINKVIISLCIISLVAYLCYFIINGVLISSFNTSGLLEYFSNLKITNNVKVSFEYLLNLNVNQVEENLSLVVQNSKLFTLILIIYIIFIEILNVALRRKYDTKSTIIKAIFVSIVLTYSVFGINYLYYVGLIQVMLTLISIINTTNLYLNRDERIKLLNS